MDELNKKGDSIMVIGYDLDDVLIDFNGALCLWHNKYFETKLVREDITLYGLENIFGCDQKEAIRRVWCFYNSPEHDLIKPHQLAVEVVGELREKYGNDFIITSRPEMASRPTYSLVGRHFPALRDRVHFASHFFHSEQKMKKSEICEQLSIDLFIEDAPMHIDDVAPVVKQVLLFDSPWNRDYSPKYDNVLRVHDWEEIKEVVRKL